MAKVSFTKLNKIKKSEPVFCKLGEENIQVETYLPIADKLDLITRIIEQAGDGETGFYNIVKLKVYYTIEMLKAYTNISFTEKQLEDLPKLYDLIVLNKIWDAVAEVLPKEESEYVWTNTCELAREVTNYNHSILGVLRAVTTDYSNTNLDIQETINQIDDPQAMQFLKQLMPLMKNANI